VNGSASGTISLNELFDYIEKKTGKKAILSEDGDEAPYNGETEYSINTEKAEGTGFRFTRLHDWVYGLIDGILEELK
jgi:nucleoside-diphosphate-sugar epimerase